LDEEEDRIDVLVQDVRTHTEHIRTFLTGIENHPQSSRSITGTIGAVLLLFYAGVIYPLSFLPLQQDWSPALAFSAFSDTAFSIVGFLLFLVSLIFTAMMLYFAWLNMSLKYPAERISKLRFFTELPAYGRYLRRMVENEQFLSELREKLNDEGEEE